VNRLDFKELEARVEDLVALCERLGRENDVLQNRSADWATERARLIEKNELAKTRIEAMIGRLRALEQDG
jgi:cell division protein ZapB